MTTLKRQPTKNGEKKPPMNARQRRAFAAGWNEQDQVARKRMAEVIWNCRSHYKKETPKYWQFMVHAARIQMNQAVMDCRELDSLREERGLPQLFMDAFAVFNNSDALAGINCRSYAEYVAVSGRKTPSSKALGLGKNEVVRKLILERFRETLRDGRTIEYALALHEGSIQKMAEKGLGTFFEDLGHTLRKHRRTPFKRSLTDWIIRAWLPLCLWECDPNGHEAHERFCHATDLLGLNFPDVHNGKFLSQFITAWRNVRSKKMKLR